MATSSIISYKVGQWVVVIYESKSYFGLIIDEARSQYCVRCLLKTQGKGYKFEPERGAIWYSSSSISLMEKTPTLPNAQGLYSV